MADKSMKKMDFYMWKIRWECCKISVCFPENLQLGYSLTVGTRRSDGIPE